jgi:uncharacterized membrane protein
MTIRQPRLDTIDVMRGAAIGAMALFHITWDLTYFGWIAPTTTQSPLFHGFGHVIAACFAGLAGFSLVLAHGDVINWHKFIRHWLRLVLAAGAITAATSYALPDGVIFFGILHCLAVSMLIGVLCLRAPVGLLCLIAVLSLSVPFMISEPALNGRFVQWLGLGTFEPATYDWRPLFPWMGVVITGMIIARLMQHHALKALYMRMCQWVVPQHLSALTTAGRHSLIIYLIHQPILFGTLFVITNFLHPMPSHDELAYTHACQNQCEAGGQESAYCARMCGCVLDGLKKSNLWEQGLSHDFTPRQHQEVEQIAQSCRSLTK